MKQNTLHLVNHAGAEAASGGTNTYDLLDMVTRGVVHDLNNSLLAIKFNLDDAAEQISDATASGGVVKPLESLREEVFDSRIALSRIEQVIQDLQCLTPMFNAYKRHQDLQSLIDAVSRIIMSQVQHRARLVKDYGTPIPLTKPAHVLARLFLHVIGAMSAGAETAAGSKATVNISVHRDDAGFGCVSIECAVAPIVNGSPDEPEVSAEAARRLPDGLARICAEAGKEEIELVLDFRNNQFHAALIRIPPA